jgi:hypothetical protein
MLFTSCSSSFQASNNIKHQQKHARVFIVNNGNNQSYIAEPLYLHKTKTKQRDVVPKDTIPKVKKKKKEEHKPDVIHLRTKEKYSVKNIKIEDSTVSYQYFYHGKDTSEHSLIKTDIQRIEYANGRVDVIANDSTPIISKKHMDQYLNRKQEPLGLLALGVGLISVAAFISLLILGGAGVFTILFGLGAITLGLISLRKIKRRPDKFKGRTAAILGMIFPSLILAYLLYIIIFFIFFF